MIPNNVIEAQVRTIRNLMLTRYVGERRQIERWDDFRHGLCSFFPATVVAVDPSMNYERARRLLARLESCGMLERVPRSSGALRYRMHRRYCDAVAAAAVLHWKGYGYSQDEIRPANPTEDVAVAATA